MSRFLTERGRTTGRRFGTAISFGFVPFALSAVAFLYGLSPTPSLACAYGVFAVGASSMFPNGSGGTVYLEYDDQDQTINWSGNSRAPAANNADKDIGTNFFTAGLQYMFNRSWGVQAEVPYWDRKFTTDRNVPNTPPDLVTTQWSDLGDIRIEGVYTGFSENLSSSLTFGVKLPTANDQFDPAVVDRDTQIGTGSTDLLLGAYHCDGLGTDPHFSRFVQALLDQPVLTSEGHRPGTELDIAGGVIYSSWTLGAVQISPLVQVIFFEQTRDTGPQSASPVASAYQRVLFSAGPRSMSAIFPPMPTSRFPATRTSTATSAPPRGC